jgi:hypothetical protein
MGRPAWLLVALILISGFVFTGCEQATIQQFQSDRIAVAGGADPPTDSFWAEVTFCRKIGRKTGKRIGCGDQFFPEQKSYVHGLVDFSGVVPGEIYAVHLVWLKPSGKEIFRRYAEVFLEESDQGYTAKIAWKKAEDLGYLKEEIQERSTPGFSLGSRFNISTSRNRELGQYSLKVYLNREQLIQRSFLIAEP